jgi:hypothetical protein
MDFKLRRESQRFLVGVWDNALRALVVGGVVMAHDSGLFVLVNDLAYSQEKGLTLDAVGFGPELLLQ